MLEDQLTYDVKELDNDMRIERKKKLNSYRLSQVPYDLRDLTEENRGVYRKYVNDIVFEKDKEEKVKKFFKFMTLK